MNKKTAHGSPKKLTVQPVIKKRRLKLARAQNGHDAARLSKCLTDQNGVKHIVLEDHVILVTYDLLKITELQIEQAIIASGEKLAEYTLERLRRAWIHYIEETELENINNTHSACCNRPPPGA